MYVGKGVGKNMKEKIAAIGISVICLFAVVAAFAHVIVYPSSVGIASFQTFTAGVPTEKDTPTMLYG